MVEKERDLPFGHQHYGGIEGTEISWKEMIAIYSFPDGEPAGTRKQYL